MCAWPRRSCTTRGWTPFARAIVAQVCRRPWGDRYGTLCLPTRRLKAWYDALGMERAAVGLAEDVVLINEAGTDEETLLEHPSSVFAKDAHRLWIEGDRPSAGGRLRLPSDEFPLDRSEGLSDADTGGARSTSAQ